MSLSIRLSVNLRGERIHVTGDTMAARTTLGSILGARWSSLDRAWTYPATPHGAHWLLDDLRSARSFGLSIHDDVAALSSRAGVSLPRRSDPLPNLPPASIPAWEHQVAASNWCLDRESALLDYRMGTGKTRAALDALRSCGAQRVLVVCPLAVVPAWAKQARIYHDGHFRVVTMDRGSILRRSAALRGQLARVSRSPVLAVVNYEGAWRPALDALLSSAQWDCIIYDECHRLKSAGATVSKWSARMRGVARARWSLSGTPLAHSPLDAYGVFRALDPGIFGTSFGMFRARYAVMGGFQNRQVIRYQNLEDFRRRFRSLTLSQDSDVLALPPEQDIEMPITLPRRAMLAYRQLREEFIVELESGETMSATNALTRALRLQQITSGFVQETGGETYEVLHAEKRDALADFLSDLDEAEPVVVFCRFRRDLESIHEAARTAHRRSMELSGSRRELEAWQEDRDGGAVLAVQIQSGSEGIDLTRAAYGVFFSLGFSLAQYVQARARLVRPTGDAARAPRPVSFYHLIATGTIDRHVYRALASRRDVIEAIIHDLPTRSEDHDNEGAEECDE